MHKLLFLSFAIILCTFSTIRSQNSKNHNFELGYGVLTFRELENTLLYPISESKGLIYGKYALNLSQNYAISILAAYDITEMPNATNENYSITTKSVLAYLEYNLVKKQYFVIYCTLGTGIQSIEKNLITGRTEHRLPVYEFTPVGISFLFMSNMQFRLESSFGGLVPLKVALRVNF